MELPNYILFSINEGQHILSTTKPFAIGQVWKWKSEQEMFSKLEEFRTNGKTVAPVMGYTIFIMFADSLIVDVFLDEQEQTELMAAYYLTHIQSKPRTYTRYEIKPYKPMFPHVEIELL